MNNLTPIKVLDCTLRDGGHVNNFDFGHQQIRNIIQSLCAARIDVIELGFLKNVTYDLNKTLFAIVAQAEALLDKTPPGQQYSLMIRPDWFDISKHEPCRGKIKNLRWAFHARDLDLAIEQALRARSLGYKIYFNPVNVFSYSEKDLKKTLERINLLQPTNVAIVDTHGAMVEDDLLKFHQIFSEMLSPEIALSLHLHENLSLSFSLAQKFISLTQGNRAAGVDSSVLGMGRIPGNLCTELIARYLNLQMGGNYDISAVYDVIQHPIAGIKAALPWGYSPLYAETAFRKMHRSYAEHLIDCGELTVPESAQILSKIVEPSDREEFNQVLIEELVVQYQTSKRSH